MKEYCCFSRPEEVNQWVSRQYFREELMEMVANKIYPEESEG